MMNGIDISNHQGNGGINLDKVSFDFLIVKATEGNYFVDKFCDGFISKRRGKPFGFYHFANGGNAIEEAEFFVKNTKNYFGKGMPILDFESNEAYSKGIQWALDFMHRVYQLTGHKCMFYSYQARLNSVDHKAIANNDYPLWVAMYGANGAQGYSQPSPPSNNAWKVISMYQYTSNGMLAGYGGRLDLNVFYGDVNTWNKLAGIKSTGSGNKPTETIIQGNKKPTKNGLEYRGHIANQGDLGWVKEGQMCGSTGKAIPLQAVEILFDGKTDRVSGQAHISQLGWQKWTYGVIGSKGKNQKIEAVQFWLGKELTELGYGLTYRSHVSGKGWGEWVKDGATSGTTGENRGIEAIEMKLYKK